MHLLREATNQVVIEANPLFQHGTSQCPQL